MLISGSFEMYRSFVKLPDECGHLLPYETDEYLLRSDLHSMNFIFAPLRIRVERSFEIHSTKLELIYIYIVFSAFFYFGFLSFSI